MGGAAELYHPAIKLIARTTVAGLETLIDTAAWDSSLYLAQAQAPGPDTPVLVVRIDHHHLGPDEDLDRLDDRGVTFVAALDMSSAQSVNFARAEHFDFAGQPRPSWTAAFLHYLAHDAYIQPVP